MLNRIEEYLLDVAHRILHSFNCLLNYNNSNILYQYKFYFYLSYCIISRKFPLYSKYISLEAMLTLNSSLFFGQVILQRPSAGGVYFTTSSIVNLVMQLAFAKEILVDTM